MVKNKPPVPEESPEKTREVLIRQALRLFGERGFEGASIREIADAARTNVASIAYHFGGKAGLHRACGEAVANMVAGAFSEAAPLEAGRLSDPDQVLKQMSAILMSMSGFLFSNPQASLVVPFILRELSDPGEAFDAIYTGMMEPMHQRLCQLWASATGGDPESDAVKLTVFSLVGQLLYFRIGAKAIARRLGHESLNENDIKNIREIIETNISLAINHSRRGAT
jgi:TetR/AcrR family transcriptional regulator, regulator of cefoperazone and chloramphenicol sensitivity